MDLLGFFLLVRGISFTTCLCFVHSHPRASVIHQDPTTGSRTDGMRSRLPVFSPWLGQAPLGAPYKYPAWRYPNPHQLLLPPITLLSAYPRFTVSSSSPSMTLVLKVLPSLPVPAGLRPRTEVSRNMPVSSSRSSFFPSIPDNLRHRVSGMVPPRASSSSMALSAFRTDSIA